MQQKETQAVSRYGTFELTSAIRPSSEQPIVPRAGYRIETYRDAQSGQSIPMLAAAVSREQLFDVLLDLVGELGDTVDVILESHHQRKAESDRPRQKLREYIDNPVLRSYCLEFSELLLEDGCFGMAIIDPRGPCEVQFDDHKVFVIFAKDLERFVDVLDRASIPRDDDLKLISEGAHLHSTRPHFFEQYEQFCYTVSAE